MKQSFQAQNEQRSGGRIELFVMHTEFIDQVADHATAKVCMLL